MIFKILAVLVILFLIWKTYERVPTPRVGISQPVHQGEVFDNQMDIFRDMEPADQTREGTWVGFLQEDVHANRTGPIGDFTGNDSRSGAASLYSFGEPTQNDDILSCNLFSKIKSAGTENVELLEKLQTKCRDESYDAVKKSIKNVHDSCEGCSCMNDTVVSSDDPYFEMLKEIDNKFLCSKTIDGIRYACKEACCDPKCT